jgi:hypothetical protein
MPRVAAARGCVGVTSSFDEARRRTALDRGASRRSTDALTRHRAHGLSLAIASERDEL